MKNPIAPMIWRVVLVYVIFASLWVYFSDRIPTWLGVTSPDFLVNYQTYKGLLFVLFSGGVIATQLRSELARRQKAEQDLEASEERFRVLYEDAPMPYQALDQEGRLLEVNRTWEEVMGISRAEVVGRLFTDFIDPGQMDHFKVCFQKLLEGGEIRGEEITLLASGGRRLLARYNARLNPAHNGVRLHCVFDDITSQRTAEEERRKQERAYRTILDTVPGMILYVDRNLRILRANRAAAEALGMTEEQLIGRPMREVFPGDAGPIERDLRQVLESGQPVVGMEARITLPGMGRRYFTVDKLPYRLGSDGLDGVLLFANDITDRTQRERELEALVAVAYALRTSDTASDMAPILLSQIVDLLDLEGATLQVRDLQTGEMVVLYGVGKWEGMMGYRIPPDSGLTGQVLLLGEPVITNNLSEQADESVRELLGGLEAAVGVPLTSERETIGVLWVGRQHQVTQQDVRVLSAIADIAGGALKRAALYEQTQQRLQRLSAMHAIDMAITNTFNKQVSLNVLLGQVVAQMKADAADVRLLDSDTVRLVFTAGRGFRTSTVQQISIRLGEGAAGEAAVEREARWVQDFSNSDDPLARRLVAAGKPFATYAAVPMIARAQVKGVIEIFSRQPVYPDAETQEFLNTLATQAAIAVDNAELFDSLQHTNSELTMSYDATIEGWSKALELRDRETQGHSLRVTEMTLDLAHRMGLTDLDISHYRRGILLHDIGKMGIPDSVLLKPGPLNEAEWEVMRQHPTYAYDLLSSIPQLRLSLDIPYYHHERWDGSGYPQGLKGEQIPLPARIFSVVDVWDALTSDRPYRSAWPSERVLEYLRSQSGKLFDPKVVEVFLDYLKETHPEAFSDSESGDTESSGSDPGAIPRRNGSGAMSYPFIDPEVDL